MKKFIVSLITSSILLVSCSNSGSHPEENSGPDTVASLEQNADLGLAINTHDEILIRKGPGDNFDKILNKVSTQAMGSPQYCSVDFSTRVEVLETKGSWSRIKVVVPDYLSDSHVGWIPSKYILSRAAEQKRFLGKLNPDDFEVLKTIRKYQIPQIHLLLKRKKYDRDYVFYFIKEYRKENCSDACNIYVYDSDIILPLIGNHDLDNKDYLTMADHLVATSMSDVAEGSEWYPYQDWKYKKLGGKNFK